MAMILKRLIFCCRYELDQRLALRNWVWLSLGVILIINAFFPSGTPAGSKMTFSKKGYSTMQAAAPALKQNLPPLDATPPARTETFTFGLG